MYRIDEYIGEAEYSLFLLRTVNSEAGNIFTFFLRFSSILSLEVLISGSYKEKYLANVLVVDTHG